MTNQNNIGPDEQHPGRHLSEAQLLAYMEGRLAGDELHEVESWLATESMESDALEGLQALPPADAREMTRTLNRQLQQSLGKKKRRKRRGMMAQKWYWLAVALVILLAVLGFAVVWLMKH